MKKYLKILTYLLSFTSLLFIIFKIYQTFTIQPKQELFTVEKAEKRTINQDVTASGVLEIKETMKMGSLVPGIVKNVFVKENQIVKKGQPLIEIELIQEDTNLRKAEHELAKTLEDLKYQEEYYKRQEQLFKSGQLSKDTFQKITKDYEKVKQDVKLAQNEVKRQSIEIKSTIISAPDEGIVTSINTSKGSAVLNDFNNVLIEVAHDPTAMNAKLDIDESDIGQVKQEQQVELAVNAYPDFTYKSKIQTIGYAPKGENNNLFYKASVDIDNSDNTLRPGMTINARIHIANAPEAISVNCQAFYLNPKSVKKVAMILGYSVREESEAKTKISKQNGLDENIKFVWVAGNKEFIKKTVSIGITDNLYYEIKSGLNLHDQVLIDVVETDQMEEFYKKMFQGPL